MKGIMYSYGYEIVLITDIHIKSIHCTNKYFQ